MSDTKRMHEANEQCRRTKAQRKAGRQQARKEESWIREECDRNGLALTVNDVQCRKNGRGRTQHWIFKRADDDRQVLHYWPGTGRCWSPLTGEKFTVACPEDALCLASLRRDA